MRLSKSRLMDVKLISRLGMSSARNAVEFLENDLAIQNPSFANRFDIVRAAKRLVNRNPHLYCIALPAEGRA
jgi:hypothetical protein